MDALIIFWLIIAVAVFAIDILSSNFCFMLFSTGAIAAAICDMLGASFMTQIVVFCILNIIVFAIGYPLLKKKFRASQKSIPLMEETYIGKIMESEKEIYNKGQVKVGGEYWTVINEGDVIYKGDKFIITGIDGIKLKIKKFQEE